MLYLLNLSKDDRAAFNARLLDLSRQFIGCVHMPEKREDFKLFNDRQLPLYFLSFHRAAAAAIMAQEAEVRARAAREKEAGEGGEVRTEAEAATAAEAAADCLHETLVASGSCSADDGPSDEELLRLSLLDVASAAADAEAVPEAEAVPFISRRPAGAAASPAVAAAPPAAEKENENENGQKHTTRKVTRGSLSDFGVCSISGLPAKYRYSLYLLYWYKSTNADAKGAARDPLTGLGYANKEAFAELRRVHAGQAVRPEEPPLERGGVCV